MFFIHRLLLYLKLITDFQSVFDLKCCVTFYIHTYHPEIPKNPDPAIKKVVENLYIHEILTVATFIRVARSLTKKNTKTNKK